MFNIVTFSLFWIVYRYIILYINQVKIDTGGLLFPKAINQLFTGLYVMELCLVGLFLLTKGTRVHGFIMLAVLILTIVYQFLLNDAFGPLFRYIPITLEDDAVRRDEEFARAQSKRFGLVSEEEEGDGLQEALNKRDREEERANREIEEIEMQEIEEAKKKPGSRKSTEVLSVHSYGNRKGYNSRGSRVDSWSSNNRPGSLGQMPARYTDKEDDAVEQIPENGPGPGQVDGQTLSYHNVQRVNRHHHRHHPHLHRRNTERQQQQHKHDRKYEFGHGIEKQAPTRSQTFRTARSATTSSPIIPTPRTPTATTKPGKTKKLGRATTASSSSFSSSSDENDIESQRGAVGDILFSGIIDEIENLTPAERDRLVQHAFQHAALRARRPVIWIPRDDLGVSDDEVRRTQRLCGGNLWISNDYTGLDAKGRVVIKRAPPDFSEVDLIKL